MAKRRNEWRRWPHRLWVGSTFDGGCTVLYHLECGHLLERVFRPENGVYWKTGYHENDQYPSGFRCGDCFHGFPVGHRTPYNNRSIWYEENVPHQLELPHVAV